MSVTRSRADDLLEAWARATDRPAPRFVPIESRGRRLVRVAIAGLVVVALVVAIVGALALGGLFNRAAVTRPPAELARMTAGAIAAAPGVQYRLSISTEDPSGVPDLNSQGLIDLHEHQFSGTADGGDGGTMYGFGGPNSGGVVLVDRLFVQSEGGPWEIVPVENAAQLRPFLDPEVLRRAITRAIDLAQIDPEVRTTACGTATCQVVGMVLPPRAATDLAAAMFGGGVAEAPPADLRPIQGELWLDPATGFPARFTTRAIAGDTTTTLTLDLTRLDEPPVISPPVP
jgi:hypothetical protein